MAQKMAPGGIPNAQNDGLGHLGTQEHLRGLLERLICRPEGGQKQEMPVKREVERPGSLRPAPAKTPEAPEPPEHPAKALV